MFAFKPYSIKVSSPRSLLGKDCTVIGRPQRCCSVPDDQDVQTSYSHLPPIVRKLSPSAPTMAKYGGRHTVAMLPGAGIGPELMTYVREVFRHSGAPVDFEIVQLDDNNSNVESLERAITSIRRNGVAIKGNVETTSESLKVKSRNVAIRSRLELYVNVLHCKSYCGVPARHRDIDVIVVRQNTEGEYAMLEHEVVDGVVESMKIVTELNTRRLARFAFEYAKKLNREKVTTIHKANIMKISDGLFLNTCRRIAEEYQPGIQHTEMIIDNCCMQLVANPHQFDVLITTNLYGSIVSNVLCGLIGGAGLLSGRNYGEFYAVFEPGTRNTGSSIAGRNVANPVAMLNASVDMLQHLGHWRHAKLIHSAIQRTICEDRIHTPDLGGTASSTDVVNSIINYIRQMGYIGH